MVISMQTVTYEYWGKTYKVPKLAYHTVVVGTGAAGFNAADSLYDLGVTDLAILTEGVSMGTSRNTGSDKQTYYKLTLAGGMPDSVRGMAQTLFDCGSMHGDIALCEAAGSARAFFRLVSLGVPFPMNEAGEYVGYKTDHDPAMRATSCGPLTSKLMTEALEKSVQRKNIPIIDRCRVIRLFTENDTVRGCAALCEEAVSADNPAGIVLFAFENMVWATGGPSAIYRATVYPESQSCAHGCAFEAGAAGENLTESQYGIASTKFRWNLSGTYQQVIPRYISVDAGGAEREFLDEYFPDPKKLLTAIFLKGYEWPFDPKKIVRNGVRGSSTIDLAVFAEIEKGNRVFLDYTRNPSCADWDGQLDFNLLEEIPFHYLSNSDALLDTPIERLQKMNAKAVKLYADHGIDLTKERLEIAVCAQHNNGGLAVNTDWESPTLHHFFPVGEAAGTFGICRPGGSALNSTQVGSFRAAQKIARDYHTVKKQNAEKQPTGFFAKLNQDTHSSAAYEAPYSESIAGQEETAVQLTAALLDPTSGMNRKEILEERDIFAGEMSGCAAFLRRAEVLSALNRHRCLQLAAFFSVHRAKDPDALRELFISYDVLLTQYVYTASMADYIADGGLSRGSAVYTDKTAAELLAAAEAVEIDQKHASYTEVTRFDRTTGDTVSRFDAVRPIPDAELWFETVYNQQED